ncbi:DsbA family oxidoreductase [Luteimonas notoginsengisoli]|uniref:DsbA family oxidoreductase n=1 Tax=Luteimonas notoginsengisoli TaxID=1578200 RepID=A0ABV7UT19_9GAMM
MADAATPPIRIDFVSDVSCPWCAIGLQALEQAIARVGDVPVELHFQPFELNPDMPAEGEDAIGHLTAKYGMSEAQARQNGEAIRARGAELGFRFDMDRRRHVWNTFDAHRLLHWAGLEGQAQQRALKHALLVAYFGDGENVSDHDTLARLAESSGLDGARARAILASDKYADAVRERERHYTDSGISAVPSVILNNRHLVQGGQPVDVFERALRQVAAGA